MPELPEVETIRRALAREFAGRRLHDLSASEPRLFQGLTRRALRRALVGQRLERLKRRAKFLIFDFGVYSAVLHLRMTGWLSLEQPARPRMAWHFDERSLYLADPRRFAALYLVPSQKLLALQPLAQLGIEPLHPSYTFDHFRALLHTKQEIKRLLLDQTKIAGLGNIYACEALFASKLHPARAASSLSAGESRRLFDQIEAILERAIAQQGTTVRTYRSLEGAGNFQNFLAVYGREGQPCVRCRAPIVRLSHGGRSSYFCPRCQRANGRSLLHS
jgi:formamidopyrimidine-DNA glycosylase